MKLFILVFKQLLKLPAMAQMVYSSELKNYDHTYFTKRDVLDITIAEGIKKFMHEHNLQRVLDVGCGTGKIIKFLNDSGFDANGCDVSGIAVKMARKLNSRKRIVQASVTKLPFRNRQFDLVISISVVEHITKNQFSKFLNETKRILKPGGYIFLVTPNFATPIRILQGKQWAGYTDPTHINFYTPAAIASTLRFNGFSAAKINIGIPYKKSIVKHYFAQTCYLPDFLKPRLFYLLFSTSLRIMRNSFWIAAQSQSKTPNCLNCHNETHQVIGMTLFDRKRYFYNECASCKLITLDPFPQKIPRSFYRFSDSYLHGASSNPQLNAVSRFFGGKKLLELYTWWCNYFRFLLVSKIKPFGNVLDVGCGEGAFLRFFNKSKWQSFGIEINPHLAKIAQRTSGAKIYAQPAENVKMQSSTFDIVTVWHVLEHFTNPKKVLKQISKSIKSGGFLVIEVPHGQALYRKIFGSHWQLLLPGQHLYFWSKESMTGLLIKSGYTIVKISYRGILSFSGASSMANWLRSRKVSSPISIYISVAVFPFLRLVNFLFVKQRENLIVIAKKKNI